MNNFAFKVVYILVSLTNSILLINVIGVFYKVIN